MSIMKMEGEAVPFEIYHKTYNHKNTRQISLPGVILSNHLYWVILDIHPVFLSDRL
jgi:hypothetical protein